jgi:hypothetical protein
MYETFPSQGQNKQEISAFPVKIELDPSVLLVPVQAVVLRSPTAPNSGVSLESQLALWDRISTVHHRQNVTHPNGELTSAVRLIRPWIRGGELSPTLVSGWYAPDDVWQACGIQLRLVNYLDIQVGDNVTLPGREGTLETPLRTLIMPIVEQQPGYIAKIPTVIFTPRCTPLEAGVGTDLPLGISLVDRGVACVSTNQSSQEVPAHELGHLFLGSQLHLSCDSVQTGAGPGDAANLMCPAGGGASLTPQQCSRAREVVSKWANFFPRRPPWWARLDEVFGFLRR